MRDLADAEQTVEKSDRIRAWPASALHASLGLPGDPPRTGDPLPPLWRWLYFLDAPRRSELGASGAAPAFANANVRGDGAFHWVGGRLAFRRSLTVGRLAHLASSFERRRQVDTNEGPVEIVTQRLDVSTSEGAAEIEERDYVRRLGGGGDETPPLLGEAPAAIDETTKARWRRRWAVDAPLLFRYAALTFDSNRLHYDSDYCRQATGASGLIVQTPLMATLLLELARELGPDRRISRFSYRLRGRLTDADAFSVCSRPAALEDGGEGADMWIETESAPKRVVMTAALAYDGKPPRGQP
ncbi:MAG: hypothetical protein MRY74_14645 [Neomegalonema sp.]|nr:hypothetical protein [Neomegalonema sp.]